MRCYSKSNHTTSVCCEALEREFLWFYCDVPTGSIHLLTTEEDAKSLARDIVIYGHSAVKEALRSGRASLQFKCDCRKRAVAGRPVEIFYPSGRHETVERGYNSQIIVFGPEGALFRSPQR